MLFSSLEVGYVCPLLLSMKAFLEMFIFILCPLFSLLLLFCFCLLQDFALTLAPPPTVNDLARISELVKTCRSNVMMAIVLSEVNQENVELTDSGPELNRRVNVSDFKLAVPAVTKKHPNSIV